MKTLAVIIAVDFPYFEEIALKAIRKYYNYYGIPLEVLSKNHPDVDKHKTSPVWNKALLFEMYDADFIIAQDLDLLPCNLKYNIMDFVNPNYFNMAVDSTRIGVHYLNYEISPAKTQQPHFRYNIGLKCYPKKYAGLTREYFEHGVLDPYKWGTFDQYYINQLIGDKQIFVNELPQIFNTFYTPSIDYNKTAFCHYTNYMTTLEKKECIEKFHPKEMLI